MQYTARWGPMGFLVSPSKIVPFNDFTTAITLKTDTGNDTSGTAATNTRGLEQQQMTFTTKYMRAVGVDPRDRVETWKSLVGQSHPLYIGEKRFGPAKMMLTGVNVSELITNNNGDFLSVSLSITLAEDTAKTTTKSYTTSSSTTESNTAASKAAATYAETVAKKKAMNATASTSDKASKKVVGGIERKVTM